MDDYFMQRRAEHPAEQENTRLRNEVQSLNDRMAMLREEVARRDEQVRNMASEIREKQAEVLEWARNRVRLGGRDHAERIIGLRVEGLRNQAQEASRG